MPLQETHRRKRTGTRHCRCGLIGFAHCRVCCRRKVVIRVRANLEPQHHRKAGRLVANANPEGAYSWRAVISDREDSRVVADGIDVLFHDAPLTVVYIPRSSKYGGRKLASERHNF